MSKEFEREPIIERVRDTLRESASVSPDPRAVARVLATVWETPAPSFWQRKFGALRMTTFTRLGAAALAGAALFVGFLSRGALSPDPAVSVDAVAVNGVSQGETPSLLVDASEGGVMAVQTQFVFEAGEVAQTVSLVGDFNDWKAGETPLTLVSDGIWTTTVPLPPGRHVYAFVLDDTLFMADPRAPRSGDVDYGREGSVVMVFPR